MEQLILTYITFRIMLQPYPMMTEQMFTNSFIPTYGHIVDQGIENKKKLVWTITDQFHLPHQDLVIQQNSFRIRLNESIVLRLFQSDEDRVDIPLNIEFVQDPCVGSQDLEHFGVILTKEVLISYEIESNQPEIVEAKARYSVEQGDAFPLRETLFYLIIHSKNRNDSLRTSPTTVNINNLETQNFITGSGMDIHFHSNSALADSGYITREQSEHRIENDPRSNDSVIRRPAHPPASRARVVSTYIPSDTDFNRTPSFRCGNVRNLTAMFETGRSQDSSNPNSNLNTI